MRLLVLYYCYVKTKFQRFNTLRYHFSLICDLWSQYNPIMVAFSIKFFLSLNSSAVSIENKAFLKYLDDKVMHGLKKGSFHVTI